MTDQDPENAQVSAPEIYALPENTDQSVHAMAKWLTISFLILVLLVGLVIYNANTLATMIPFSAEKRFVEPYESVIGKTFGKYSAQSPDIEAYLEELAEKLSLAMEVPEEIEISVHYIDVDEANAFATLGGHIFVYSGLLAALPDENSLAMVLAHEIAHIQHRDPIASLSRGVALQMIYGFLVGGGQSVTDIFGGFGQALFSRKQEETADRAALAGLFRHYGQVHGYRTFFELVQEEIEDDSDGGFEAWFSSHPSIQKRLQYLDSSAEELGAAVGESSPMPDRVINELNSL